MDNDLDTGPDDALDNELDDDTEDALSAWDFEQGATMAPGLRAWARIGDGDRYESYPGDVGRLGMQLAGVLHYLHHGAGIAHLDVKPSNICLVDGRPVLLDFDAACQVGRRRHPDAPIGSPPYMAPEQFRDDEVTPRSDLFALGAVLYEAATGQCPYHPEETPDGWTVPQERGAPPVSDARSVLTALARSLPPGEEGVWPPWVR